MEARHSPGLLSCAASWLQRVGRSMTHLRGLSLTYPTLFHPLPQRQLTSRSWRTTDNRTEEDLTTHPRRYVSRDFLNSLRIASPNDNVPPTADIWWLRSDAAIQSVRDAVRFACAAGRAGCIPRKLSLATLRRIGISLTFTFPIRSGRGCGHVFKSRAK